LPRGETPNRLLLQATQFHEAAAGRADPMNASLLHNSERDFFAVASEQGMLTPETAYELVREAARLGVTPLQLVLQKGLLDPVQVSIVQTLLNPETTFPGYQVLGVIGRGGMGVVYRARQLNLDRVVALKAILVSQLAGTNITARFEQEALAIGRLQHPHIIAAYDFGRHEDRLYLVLELVEGEDLEKYITRHGRLSEATAWGIARQAAAGLAHAAQLGIVHRDIKPANLLLVPPPAGVSLPPGLPMVKITDFGLAFLEQQAETRTRLTAIHTTLGSPHYMAPEQFSGTAVDLRADIYSLGATVFHMLAGAPPFQGSSLAQIVGKKMAPDWSPLQDEQLDASPETAFLLAEMMAVDPEARIGDYATLLARIDQLPADLPAAKPLSPAPRSGVPGALPTPLPLDSSNLETRVFLREDTSDAVVTSQNRRRVFRLGVGTLVVLLMAMLLGGWLLWKNSGPGRVPQRDFVLSGWSQSLFNGEDLADWQPISGEWIATEDANSTGVLSGTDGVARRPLFRPGESVPVPIGSYRLRSTVNLQQARAVEIQFDIVASASHERKLALRMTPEGAQLLRYSSATESVEYLTRVIPYNQPTSGYQDITVERQRGYWFVSVGEKRIGAEPVSTETPLSEFRLAVEGGPAWFANLQVEELVSPDAAPIP